MKILSVIIICYLIGSISSSYVLGKIFLKSDIRSHGSGNAGTTNAMRVFGKKIGLVVFVFDFLKGMIAVYIGGKILGYNGELIGGFLAVIGHIWPIFLGFKGGKGIATSFGVIVAIYWPVVVIYLIFFASVLLISKYVSLASILTCVIAPIVIPIIQEPFDKKFYIMVLLLAAMLVYKHKGNIKRLINGEEYKIGQSVNRE